jgi:hypothetical protein
MTPFLKIRLLIGYLAVVGLFGCISIATSISSGRVIWDINAPALFCAIALWCFPRFGLLVTRTYLATVFLLCFLLTWMSTIPVVTIHGGAFSFLILIAYMIVTGLAFSSLRSFTKEKPNQPLQRNASTGSVSNLKSPARRGCYEEKSVKRIG